MWRSSMLCCAASLSSLSVIIRICASKMPASAGPARWLSSPRSVRSCATTAAIASANRCRSVAVSSMLGSSTSTATLFRRKAGPTATPSEAAAPTNAAQVGTPGGRARPPAATAPVVTKESVDNPYGLEALWKQGDVVARGTLVIMIIMSIGSWYIIFTKLFEQGKLLRGAKAITDSFWKAASLKQGAAALEERSAFRYIAEQGIKADEHHEGTLVEQIDRHTWISMSVDRAVGNIQSRLQDGLAFLATVDEIQIYNRALAPAVVGAVFQSSRPPVFVEQPTDALVFAADDASFEVIAQGTGPLVYQWFKDGAEIPGATEPDLLVSGATHADAGAGVELGAPLAHDDAAGADSCLLYTSPSPRDRTRSRMPSSA